MRLRTPVHHKFGDFESLSRHFTVTEEKLETHECRVSQIRIGDDGQCFVKSRDRDNIEHVEEGDMPVGFFTDPSLSKYATFMKIPIRYLFSIDDDSFFAAVVNQRGKEKGPKNNGARVRVCPHEGIVVGITSDTYAYYKNADLLEDVRLCLDSVNMEDEVVFGGASLWNYRFDMNLLSQTRAVSVRGTDRYVAGLRLINSCDGATSIQVVPFLRKDTKNVKRNEWAIGAVNASDKLVRIIHKGSRFNEKLSSALSVSSDTFERLVRGMTQLGTTYNVSVSKWKKMIGFVAAKLGNKKQTEDFFETGITGFKQNGILYYACDKWDTESQEPIQCTTGDTDRRGRKAFIVGYTLDQVTSHPDYDVSKHTVWFTRDMKQATGCFPASSTVNLSDDLIKRLDFSEYLIQERDPYAPFQALLKKAEETDSQDRRLDLEMAAGEILNEFIGK